MTATKQPTTRGRAFVEWFWRGRALAQARAAVDSITADQKGSLRRAKTAFDLGEHALAPDSSPDSGSAAVAADLFRQAAYWALLARATDQGRPSAQELWAASDQNVLLAASAGLDDLAALRPLFEADFTDFAHRPPAEQRFVAHRLEGLASRLISARNEPLAILDQAKIQRLFGVALLFLCVLAVAVGATAGYRRATKKPNLAAGKPWTISSEYAVCKPTKGECGGAITDIFFHTKNDDNPWFEYDFGAPIRFSSLTIENRRDFGPERSVPLIVEVSADKKTYAQIARRDDVFDTWRPSFSPQNARYLRLRVPRPTWLHLEAVEVHR